MPPAGNVVALRTEPTAVDAPLPATAETAVARHAREGTVHVDQDAVAVEEPLEPCIEGKSIAVLMRTPGHDEELVAGFLLTEGLITSRADVFEINRCPAVTGEPSRNVIDVLLARPDPAQLERLTRHVFSSSSCGICGKATIASVHLQFAPLATPAPQVSVAVLRTAPEKLLRRQDSFRTTGGLHAAALLAADGEPEVVREDVGRHNAVDKVLGRMLLDDRLPASALTLFVSGRVSFEIVQKALAARIAVIAAVSAPTSLAIDFARASGQTLVGFVRDGRMNVYSGAVE